MMQFTVLVEPVSQDSYCARVGEPLPLSAEGATREEAVSNLRRLIEKQIEGGMQIVTLELDTSRNPWLAMAGMHDPNDPLIREWKKAMEAYRHEKDNDPDYP